MRYSYPKNIMRKASLLKSIRNAQNIIILYRRTGFAAEHERVERLFALYEKCARRWRQGSGKSRDGGGGDTSLTHPLALSTQTCAG